MFIRKVTKTNGVTEKKYEYLHLVESVRTEDGVRQKLIMNLGNLDIDPSQYKALARRIEDMLTGQQSFVELEPEIEKHAQKITRKIFRKRAKEAKEESEADFKEVDVSSFEAESARSLGPEHLCLSAWKELKLDSFLLDKGISPHTLPLIKAGVIGRMIDPGSERHTKEWAEERSALYELCTYPERNSLNSYYRSADHLYSVKESLESYLSKKEKDLFSLEEKMIFLDLTNTYFEGQAGDNPKAKRGRSKDKRHDCKLVTLGLVVDENGFAKTSRFFPGNQSEPDTLEEMIKAMEKTKGKGDRTVVMDAGVATKDNIAWLKKEGYHYIVVNRGKRPESLEDEEFEVIREDSRKDLCIEVKRVIEDGEVYLLCKSSQRKLKEEGIRVRVEELFVDRLAYYKKGLTVPYRTKKYKKVIEMIGRLKEKYPKASKLYEVEVIPEPNKNSDSPDVLAVDIKWRKKSLYEGEISSEGTYCLRSDRMDLSDKEIWEIYIMLNQVERAFRSLKTDLGLQPNFHQLEDRVDAHNFISIVAYHLMQVILFRLRRKGYRKSWKSILNTLSTHQRLTLTYREKIPDGTIQKQFLRLSTTPEAEQMRIYQLFGISGNPLPQKQLK